MPYYDVQDGFSGLNPGQALSDINNFRNNMEEVTRGAFQSGSKFFADLKNSWHSPNAVIFSNKYSNMLYDCTVKQIAQNANQLVQGVVNAYNSIARSHGLGGIGGTQLISMPGGDFTKLNESGPNGVGMDIDKVKNSLNEYKSQLGKVRSNLSNVPSNLAIYDKSGAVQASFNSAINSLKNRLTSIIEDISRDIQLAIEEEQNKLNTSVNAAASSLEGGNGSSSLLDIGSIIGAGTGSQIADLIGSTESTKYGGPNCNSLLDSISKPPVINFPESTKYGGPNCNPLLDPISNPPTINFPESTKYGGPNCNPIIDSISNPPTINFPESTKYGGPNCNPLLDPISNPPAINFPESTKYGGPNCDPTHVSSPNPPIFDSPKPPVYESTKYGGPNCDPTHVSSPKPPVYESTKYGGPNCL